MFVVSFYIYRQRVALRELTVICNMCGGFSFQNYFPLSIAFSIAYSYYNIKNILGYPALSVLAKRT